MTLSVEQVMELLERAASLRKRIPELSAHECIELVCLEAGFDKSTSDEVIRRLT